MKIKLITITLFAGLLFASCDTDSLGVEENVNIIPDYTHYVNFEKGTTFKYIKVLPDYYLEAKNSYNYGYDTVVVEIVDIKDGIYYLCEYYYSQTLADTIFVEEMSNTDDNREKIKYSYLMENYNDSLIIKSPDLNPVFSYLFDTSFTEIILPLEDVIDNEAEPSIWTNVDIPGAGSVYGYTSDIVQLDNFYSRLNMFSYKDMNGIWDRKITMLYSKKDWIVRVVYAPQSQMTYDNSAYAWLLKK